MNRLAALHEWARPATSLATGITAIFAMCYVPFTIYYELQIVKASNADVKASNTAVLATVTKLDATVTKLEADNAGMRADVKARNIEMRAAMQLGFAELKADIKANQRRWI